MARPKGHKGFTVTLDPETRARYDNYCKKNKRSLNIQTVILIEEFLDKEDAKNKNSRPEK
jgi:hypothetical protein